MNKSQIQRLVQRLADKLEVPRLLTDLDGQPHVPAEFESLIDEVRDVLFKYTMIQEKANLARRTFLIRIDGYWSHVEQFWGEALGRFERANPEIRIELAPWFGRNRDGAGAGLLADLKDKKIDLVIAPWDPALAPTDSGPDKDNDDGLAVLWDPNDPHEVEEARGLRYLPAYRWALAAAIRRGHPLSERIGEGELGDRQLDVAALAEGRPVHPLVVAPSGHSSRLLLDAHQTPSRRFAISSTSPEPAALVALGATSDRVPVIPTDSEVTWQGHWPVLVTRGPGGRSTPRILGGTFAVYWRETSQPTGLIASLRMFAEQVALASNLLDPIDKPWGGGELLTAGPPPDSWRTLDRIRDR